MSFTEFCCRSGGSNLNAGTRTGNSTEPGTSASFTYASGNWVASTGVFTVASGNPSSDGVAVGDFVNVYPDGSTVGVFVGRVTARDTTTITVSLTAKMGTAPTDGTGNRTLKVGGAWLGPNGASGFPLTLIAGTLTNSGGDLPRVNMKNDATYSITAQITSAASGNLTIQGYTSAYADGGTFKIDGGTSGASYNLFSLGHSQWSLVDGEFCNNGATGSADGIVSSTSFWTALTRIIVHDIRGRGMNLASNAQLTLDHCEAYNCNQSNSGAFGQFVLGAVGGLRCHRCIAHDGSGSNTQGFRISGGSLNVLSKCIADTNGNVGFAMTNGGIFLDNCDAYNNGSDGVNLSSSGNAFVAIENCNLVKNGGWGIQFATNHSRFGYIRNCGYGSGTQVNTSGTSTGLSSLGKITEVGAITYASNVTPWTDPANGDFRINLATAKNTGYGAFTQTQASYSGTTAYPDIGAAQHQDSGGGVIVIEDD